MSEPHGPDWAFDGDGKLWDLSKPPHLVAFGPPAPIRWVNVTDLAGVIGRRAAISQQGRIVYDQRIVCDVYTDLDGAQWVNLVHEPQWWDWIDQGDQRPGRIPRAVAIRAMHVWVEVRESRSPGDDAR